MGYRGVGEWREDSALPILSSMVRQMIKKKLQKDTKDTHKTAYHFIFLTVMAADILTKYTVRNGWRFSMVNSECQFICLYSTHVILTCKEKTYSGRYF